MSVRRISIRSTAKPVGKNIVVRTTVSNGSSTKTTTKTIRSK